MINRRKLIQGIGATVLATPALGMSITRFSDIGIIAGGSATVNTAALRGWVGENKAILIDDASAPYDFDTGGVPINLAFSKMAIIAESPRAVLRHTAGNGQFLSFNGHAQYPTRDAAKRITFGEPGRPIMVRGRVGTSDLIYANKLEDCRFHVRVRDADVLFRVNGAGQPVPLAQQIGAVLCTFDVTSGPGLDDEPFIAGSRYGFFASNCYNNQCRLNIEGNGGLNGVVVPLAGYAIYFDQSNRNDIAAGSTAESNWAGGTWFSSTCEGNTTRTTDNEVNANGSATVSPFFDWVFRGTRNVAYNIAGRCEINGINNVFYGSAIPNSVVNSLGTNSKHSFIGCDLAGWTDTGNLSWVRNCTVPDKN